MIIIYAYDKNKQYSKEKSIYDSLELAVRSWADERKMYANGQVVEWVSDEAIYYEDTEAGKFVQAYPIMEYNIPQSTKTTIRLSAVGDTISACK